MSQSIDPGSASAVGDRTLLIGVLADTEHQAGELRYGISAMHRCSRGSDYKGAALMIDALPPAKELLGDKGYDADWFRQALAAHGITACIPSKSNRK